MLLHELAHVRRGDMLPHLLARAALSLNLGLGLNEKAMEAVGQWTFQPGTKEGLPVTVAATIEVNWRLF